MRFDVAYLGAFKCNLRRLQDYPNLWGYARELYQMPGIVPKGPIINFATPHDRGRLNGEVGRRVAAS